MDNIDEIIGMIEQKNEISLSREKFQPLYEQLIPCELGKNELISQIGDVNQRMYIVIEGIIRLYYIDLDGNDITRFFGEQGCIGGLNTDRLPYAIETVFPTRLLMADFAIIKNQVKDDIYWVKLWNQLLQNTVRYKTYREGCFLMKSATERYLDFKSMHPHLEEQVNQAHIASYLGVTPVSLSRIRKAIKEETNGEHI